MKSKPLTENGYRRKAEKIFTSIFTVDELSGELYFAASITNRAILYPIHYQLTKAELQAVVQAMRSVGDNALYVSLLERAMDPDSIYQWFIPLQDIDAYYSLDADYRILENAIYSPTGQWGLRATMDQYAIVGGSCLFIDTLFKHLPVPADEQLHEFLDDCRYDTDLEWLRNFLTCLYGQEKAQELMLKVGLLS